MLRWIRVSSIIESFIFLIAWGIFFGWWELYLQFLPSSLLLLWVELLLLPRVCWKQSLPSGTHYSHEWITWSWEPIQVGHHHFYILRFFFYHFKLFLIWETLMTAWSLHSWSSHSSIGFLRSYSNLCSFLQIGWPRNQTSSVSLEIHL